MRILAPLVALLLATPAMAQVVRVGGGADEPADPFQAKVNKAIQKGVDFLVSKHPRGTIRDRHLELVLLTLLDSDIVPQTDRIIVTNMNKLLRSKLNQVYNGGLRGLILEKVDRKRYQKQLMELAYFYAQSQCKNGHAYRYPHKAS